MPGRLGHHLERPTAPRKISQISMTPGFATQKDSARIGHGKLVSGEAQDPT
jgi:hypothetical protein